MKIGLSQSQFKHIPMLQVPRACREAGFKFCEANPDFLDQRFTSRDDFMLYADTCRSEGLNVAQAHLPFWHGIDIGNYNQLVREYSMDIIREAISRSAELGEPRLVLHPGTWAGSADKALVDIFRDNVIRSVREAFEYANGLGLVVCVENMLRTECDGSSVRYGAMVADIIEICRAVPGVKAHLDTGHAYHNGENPAECALSLAYEGLLYGLHVQDTDGFPNDRHWLPGKGKIDWAEFNAALEKTSYYADGGKYMLELTSRVDDPHELAKMAFDYCREAGLV